MKNLGLLSAAKKAMIVRDITHCHKLQFIIVQVAVLKQENLSLFRFHPLLQFYVRPKFRLFSFQHGSKLDCGSSGLNNSSLQEAKA
jgi:hypothetical protein